MYARNTLKKILCVGVDMYLPAYLLVCLRAYLPTYILSGGRILAALRARRGLEPIFVHPRPRRLPAAVGSCMHSEQPHSSCERGLQEGRYAKSSTVL